MGGGFGLTRGRTTSVIIASARPRSLRLRKALRLGVPFALVVQFLCLAAPAGAEPVPTTPPQNLSPAGQDAHSPQVAVGLKGNAVAVWSGSDGTNFRIQARRRSASGILGPVQTLSVAGQDADGPQVAVDSGGNAVVVWDRFHGTNFRIQALRRSASGTLSSVQDLSPDGQDADSPRVAVDPNGNAVVVWRRPDGTHDRTQARRISASGTLSSVETLSAPGQDAFDPQVAVDPNGNAVVVWTRNDGTDFRVQARRRSASGTLSPVQTLSPAGQNAGSPQVGADAGGNAVAVWVRPDGANLRIQGARLSRG